MAFTFLAGMGVHVGLTQIEPGWTQVRGCVALTWQNMPSCNPRTLLSVLFVVCLLAGLVPIRLPASPPPTYALKSIKVDTTILLMPLLACQCDGSRLIGGILHAHYSGPSLQ